MVCSHTPCHLRTPRDKEYGMSNSGEYGDHLGSQRLLISRFGNRWSSLSIMMLAVCRIDPSCWNHCTSRFTPRRVPNGLQNLFNTSMKRSFVTVTVSSAFSIQNGSIIPYFSLKAMHLIRASEAPRLGVLCPNAHNYCL